ncbi:hypothetical protein EH183_42690 [Streptomyces sp. CB01881]|uniref:DUF4097 family beta strand repeat-containing protein n=1 Tax=Streptomyces sp. CB01881 TaxID=2078691 RepID=UPI0011DFC4DE|nr:DUF4097 family beta strand repeat-containing protein [Streptomyces sp. CB01881]TYC66423.1 hypothetical protein EH183_42690 [Streptomyces sp. CB01881]
MQKFDTPAPVAAVLDIPAGLVRLVAAERGDTVVEVLPKDASKGRDVKAAEQITVEYTGGVLRIQAPAAKNRVLGNSGQVAVTVHLPAGSRVEAKAALAELHSEGRLGEVAFDAAQATVDLEETAGARLTLQAGDIRLARLTGPAHLTTRSGDLTITEATGGTLTLRTEHGDITVGAARGVSATLDAGTAYGRIHNTLHNTDGAAAGLAITATTSYGNITARSV